MLTNISYTLRIPGSEVAEQGLITIHESSINPDIINSRFNNRIKFFCMNTHDPVRIKMDMTTNPYVEWENQGNIEVPRDLFAHSYEELENMHIRLFILHSDGKFHVIPSVEDDRLYTAGKKVRVADLELDKAMYEDVQPLYDLAFRKYTECKDQYAEVLMAVSLSYN
jgi:hypothetical protein